MIWPGPTKISDFQALPNSIKSTLSGDTVQFPNVSGYFSNHFRDFVVYFYVKNYQDSTHFPFPPLRLNHPPEYSWTVINVNTDTTFLEELVYPLRDSLFVNGFETYRPNGTKVFWGGPRLMADDKEWAAKTTLRFYSSNFLIKIIVWLGIIISISKICKLGREIAKE